MELERVLTKLKFDDAVSGYALVTNDGAPFLSFSLPDDVLPQIQGTLRVHSQNLRLMNVMTGEGTVILARVDENWVLAVLFVIEQSLGMALQKTKDVVSLLEGIDLPPPPDSLKKEATSTEQVTTPPPVSATTSPSPTAEAQPDIPMDEIQVRHGCVVNRAERFSEATRIDSEIHMKMKDKYASIGVDILLMVDEKRTVFKLAEAISKPVEPVIDVVKWLVSKRVLAVECPEEQETGKKEIVEMPVYEGELDKAKKEHRGILQLCDGTRTMHEIAEELGIPYFKALQSVVDYRGKTLKFVRKTRISG